ncbi:hypothetical protein [Methanoregula sp.]|uniref:hypothetical protein n=1 Tax=Methanoregula sp. TaxID=2052170 RepID=UPI002372A8DF|nr:hypothetical protein [Methanoregula sp.]MDD1686887.1 hypothetical protein [Methanoregula sp.]
MTGHPSAVLAGTAALMVLILCAGCVSTGIGDTWYDNRSVLVNISNTGNPADVHVQVTIYRITGLTQEPYGVVSAPASLLTGENTVAVPVGLSPGNYKLYVYILKDGDRKTAVIRDITV